MDEQLVDAPSVPRHPIRIVAERTGLTPATLRAWERRYGAVDPGRSTGAQRLYSDDDVYRLRLIARLSAVGYALSDLSQTATPTLARMARMGRQSRDPVHDAPGALAEARADAVIDRLLADTRALDSLALRAGLTKTVFSQGPVSALDNIVSPFLEQVGIAWACREISVAQEHLASAVVRDVLGWLLQTTTTTGDAPTLVATSVADDQHEFGAMMAAIVAAIAGWRVLYLGPNLPAEEIARVARSADARVVALSVVNPQPTRALRDQLDALRRTVGKRTRIVAGGASALDHRLTMQRCSIELLDSRAALGGVLGELWNKA